MRRFHEEWFALVLARAQYYEVASKSYHYPQNDEQQKAWDAWQEAYRAFRNVVTESGLAWTIVKGNHVIDGVTYDVDDPL